jgi:hypothetical protein
MFWKKNEELSQALTDSLNGYAEKYFCELHS